jgi:hypothetical protein
VCVGLLSLRNLHVPAQPVQAFEHPRMADASEFAAPHLGKLGLRHSQEIGRALR